MININPLPPSPYHPDAAAALLTLAAAVSNTEKLKELLAHFKMRDQRIRTAQKALEDDRSAFAREKQEWYAKSGREWDDLQQRLSRELQDHNERMAAAERDLQMRDEENRRKWNPVASLLQPTIN